MKRGVVVDYKKREQWDAGRLTHPDDNDQLHAYALGAGLTNYSLCLLLFGGGRVEPIWSQWYGPDNTGPVLERIRAIGAAHLAAGPDPKGTSGTHCGQCWPREHCPHWAKRTETEPDPTDGPALILAAKSAEDSSKRWRELAKHLADKHNGFRVGSQEFRAVFMPGKMSVDSAALERDGLYEQYAKIGRPFPQYRLCRPEEKQ